MRWRVLAVLLGATAAPAGAGIIRGIVLEHATGFALARARVRLEAFSGNELKLVATIQANRGGQFFFPSVAEGFYLLSATRDTYATAWYGQKRPGSPGVPITVTKDSDLFTELRLRKLGAISGRLMDENKVGMPGMMVLAYQAAIPLRLAAQAKADDRGVYRIGGLTPGRYYVRSAPHTLDDGLELQPTFSPESAGARDARVVLVELDGDAADQDIRPMPGRLLRLSGRLLGCTGMALVTLAHDTGRRQSTVPCVGAFTFDSLPPGDYELLAESAKAPATSPVPDTAAFRELSLDRDTEVGVLPLAFKTTVSVTVTERAGGVLKPADFPVMIHRKDPAGESETVALTRDLRLAPGYFEITALPPPTHYLDTIGQFPDRRIRSRAGVHPDWHEVALGLSGITGIRVVLSSGAASLSGRVFTTGGAMVPGAPVFLLPATPEGRRRMNGPRTMRTDRQGAYRFAGGAGPLPGPQFLRSGRDHGGEPDERARALDRAAGRGGQVPGPALVPDSVVVG